MKFNPAPSTIATILVPKSKAAPEAIPVLPSASAIPAVAIGGTKAAAIATPAKAPLNFGHAMQYEAAIPETKASSKVPPTSLR